MKTTSWFILMTALVLVTSGVLAQGVIIDQVVTARQIADANGSDVARPDEVTATADGRFVITDTSDSTNERVYLIDPSTDPPTFTLVTDANALKAKVDAVNGAAPAPSTLTIQALGVDEDGQIIIASDFSGDEMGLIFRVNPETGETKLLAGLDGPPLETSVEGISTIGVRGRTIYVVLEANFGAINGDTVVTVSVDAPDGGQTPAEELVSEDAFREIEGFLDPLAFRFIGFLPNGHLVLADSASRDASDDLLEIDTTTGAVSLLVAATDIEADLGTDDIGPNGGGVDPDGTIYLTNAFGVGETDDGVIVIRNAGGGTGEASLLASESEIIASPNIFDIDGNPLTSLRIQNSGAVSPGLGTIVFVDGHCDCLIRVAEVMPNGY